LLYFKYDKWSKLMSKTLNVKYLRTEEVYKIYRNRDDTVGNFLLKAPKLEFNGHTLFDNVTFMQGSKTGLVDKLTVL
jgi:hypothetical protein